MQKILWCVQKNRNTASERHELFYIVCVCVCLDKCSQSALKCSFPGMVCCKASVVGGQFRGLSPFLFLLSPSGTSFAVGSAKLCSALLCSTCRVPFAATQIKSRGFGTSLRQLFFFSGTTFQGHNCTQCHSREPGCVSKPICFMRCFLFFSHSPLFCLLSLNCGDSQGQIRTFLPGEIKEGLLEAWLSLFQLKKIYKNQTFQHLLEPAQMYMLVVWQRI